MTNGVTKEEAIESLEAQRDCIILSCHGGCHGGKECDECDFMYAKGTMGTMRQALDMAITALKERKIGKWIKQNPMVDTEECSECGWNIVSEELETPYCPYCGAKMEGAEDETHGDA